MDYMVRLVTLPRTVPAVTVQQEDFCNIYINDQLDSAQQRKALEHELCHIRRNDFSDSLDLTAAEAYRPLPPK